MEAKLNDIVRRLKGSDRKIKIAVAVGLVGILLLGLSEVVPHEKKTADNEISYTEYTAELEKKTQDIISSIDGVGECRVMLTLKNSNESVYAKNNTENSDNGNYSRESEYVLYDGENGEEPVLVKEYFPQVMGVVVVCTGGDSFAVRESVIACVSSLYGLPSTKISVSKLKE